MRPRSIEPWRSSCKPYSVSTARRCSSSSTPRRARAPSQPTRAGGRRRGGADRPGGCHGHRAHRRRAPQRQPREFTPADIDLADTLASQAATALAVLRMRERLSPRADRQAALARAAGALNARLELRAVLDTLCREADQALGADVSGVYLGNAEVGGRGPAARRAGRLRLVGPHDPRRRGRGRARACGRRAGGHEQLPQRGPHPEHRCDAGRGLGGGSAEGRAS